MTAGQYSQTLTRAITPRPRLGAPKPKRQRKRKLKSTDVKSEPAGNVGDMKTEFPEIFDPHDLSGLMPSSGLELGNETIGGHASGVRLAAPDTAPQSLYSVAAPNLVLPSTVTTSVPVSSQSELVGIHSSSVQPVGHEEFDFVPELPAMTRPACSERDVTTPPLPVLSPTCFFDDPDSPEPGVFPDFDFTANATSVEIRPQDGLLSNHPQGEVRSVPAQNCAVSSSSVPLAKSLDTDGDAKLIADTRFTSTESENDSFAVSVTHRTNDGPLLNQCVSAQDCAVSSSGVSFAKSLDTVMADIPSVSTESETVAFALSVPHGTMSASVVSAACPVVSSTVLFTSPPSSTVCTRTTLSEQKSTAAQSSTSTTESTVVTKSLTSTTESPDGYGTSLFSKRFSASLPAGAQGVTSLVSSSGALFRLPELSTIESNRRRFSEQGSDTPVSARSQGRRRSLSDPCRAAIPSSTSSKSEVTVLNDDNPTPLPKPLVTKETMVLSAFTAKSDATDACSVSEVSTVPCFDEIDDNLARAEASPVQMPCQSPESLVTSQIDKASGVCASNDSAAAGKLSLPDEIESSLRSAAPLPSYVGEADCITVREVMDVILEKVSILATTVEMHRVEPAKSLEESDTICADSLLAPSNGTDAQPVSKPGMECETTAFCPRPQPADVSEFSEGMDCEDNSSSDEIIPTSTDEAPKQSEEIGVPIPASPFQNATVYQPSNEVADDASTQYPLDGDDEPCTIDDGDKACSLASTNSVHELPSLEPIIITEGKGRDLDIEHCASSDESQNEHASSNAIQALDIEQVQHVQHDYSPPVAVDILKQPEDVLPTVSGTASPLALQIIETGLEPIENLSHSNEQETICKDLLPEEDSYKTTDEKTECDVNIGLGTPDPPLNVDTKSDMESSSLELQQSKLCDSKFNETGTAIVTESSDTSDKTTADSEEPTPVEDEETLAVAETNVEEFAEHATLVAVSDAVDPTSETEPDLVGEDLTDEDVDRDKTVQNKDEQDEVISDNFDKATAKCVDNADGAVRSDASTDTKAPDAIAESNVPQPSSLNNVPVPAANVPISPGLTSKVIEQLSNYNAILSFLARPVTPPSEIANLTTVLSNADANQAEVISALIANLIPVCLMAFCLLCQIY